MKARIPALLLILAMAGAAFAQSEPAPLTGDEKFGLINGELSISRARESATKVANETKEAKVLAVAVDAYQKTKEFKAADIAIKAAQQAIKIMNATKEAKAVNVARASADDAAKGLKEVLDADRMQKEYEVSKTELLTKRGISPKTHYICKGPSMAFVINGIPPDTSAIDETCKGVPDSGVELRPVKAVKK